MKNGKFYCEDSAQTARNIMFIIEGLKISAQTMGISEDMVNKELFFILDGLMIEQ